MPITQSQLVAILPNSAKVAAAIGLPNPPTYSPETLADICRWRNAQLNAAVKNS